MMRLSGLSTSRRTSALACLLVLTACYTSPAPHVVALADSQRGAMVMLHMTDGSARTGELLAVRDSSLLLLRNQRVVTAPLSSIVSMDLGDTRLAVAQRERPRDLLERVRDASRFPYGITPAAMSALLRSTGQDAPTELRAGVP
jgi:hypothetical protein